MMDFLLAKKLCGDRTESAASINAGIRAYVVSLTLIRKVDTYFKSSGAWGTSCHLWGYKLSFC